MPPILRFGTRAGQVCFWTGLGLLGARYVLDRSELTTPGLALGIGGWFVEKLCHRFARPEPVEGLLRRRLAAALLFFPLSLLGWGLFFGALVAVKSDISSRVGLLLTLIISTGSTLLQVAIALAEVLYRRHAGEGTRTPDPGV